MSDSLFTLLSTSWQFFAAHIKPILIASLLFASCIFGAQYFFEVHATDSMQHLEQLEALSTRLEGGDEDAFLEMMLLMGVMEDAVQFDQHSMHTMMWGLIRGALPAFGVFFIVVLIVTILANTYFLLLAVDEGANVLPPLKRMPSILIPLIGVWIWAFLRSLVWIPFLGILFGIVLGPRFLLSSVILARERTGILKSVRFSYSRSRGYWGKIVGNMLVMAILAWMAMIVLLLAIGFVSGSSYGLYSFLFAFAQQLVTAYAIIFLVKLADTIMANPLVVVSAQQKTS